MESKVIEKIQKLLALGKSCNENEAQLSLLKAQELLAKHKLTMAEVEDHKATNINIGDKRTGVTFTKAGWKARLAQVVASNFGCYVYFKVCYSKTVMFFGKDEDVEVCKIVFEYAVDSVLSEVGRIKRKYVKDRRSVSGLENDYGMGFVYGLNQKFEEQKSAHQEWGLVLVIDKAVVEAYEKKQIKKRTVITDSFKGNYGVYNMGETAGREFSISDKLAGSDPLDSKLLNQ